MRYFKKFFHPIAFALYPFLAAWEFNYFEIWPQEFAYSLWIALAIAAVFLTIATLLLKSLDAACVLLSFTVVAALGYGPFVSWWENDSSNPGTALVQLQFTTREIVPLLIWVSLLILLVIRLRSIGDRAKNSHMFLNIFAAILLVFSGLQIAKHRLREVTVKTVAAPLDTITCQADSDLPDIYYIILDGFGRQDVLKQLYSYDNPDLIDYLKSENFYLADKATSNYHRTFFSLSSSLNSSYLDQEFLKGMKDQSALQAGFESLIHNSSARKFFEKIGYQSVAFENGDRTTEVVESDLYIKNNGANRAFATGVSYMQLPWLRELISKQLHQQHRALITTQFEAAAALGQEKKPKFVYMHVLAPHPPFVFEEDGSGYFSNRVFTFGDGGDYGGQDDYRIRYKAQVNHISRLSIQLVKKLLSLPQKPIIIIQGDHGPGSGFNLNSLEETDLVERFSILNAYFFPSANYNLLYPEISPVNTFRTIIDQLPCSKIPLEKDRSYFSTSRDPLNFVDVTLKRNGK